MNKLWIGFLVILLVMVGGLLTAYGELRAHEVKSYKNGLFIMKEVGMEHA